MLNTKIFIDRAKAIHGSRFDYQKSIYTHSHSLITIICSIHGEFQQKASSHLKGKGCFKCYSDAKVKDTEQFLERARKIHGNKYDYSKTIWKSSQEKVTIICPVHGQFIQKINNHLTGQACQACANSRHSGAATKWLDYRSASDGVFIQHAFNGGEFWIPGTKFHADGYCKETNTIYEFYGDQWHGNPKIYASDFQPVLWAGKKQTAQALFTKTQAREAKIRALGYNLVTIWESEWNEIKPK